MYVVVVVLVLFGLTSAHPKGTESPIEGTLGQASQHFTLNLLKELWKEDMDANLVISPISISMVLSMAMAGAAGDTAQEMKEGLQLTALADPYQAYKEAVARSNVKNATGYRLNMGNFMFVDKELSMLESFQELVRSYYVSASSPAVREYPDDPLFTLDFSEDVQQATEFINEVVSKDTSNKITDLIPQGALDPDTTRLVLVNAIYFYGDWKYHFNGADTKVEDFHLLGGTTAPVSMMRLRSELRYKYCEETNADMVELPYAGDEIAMYLLVPREVDGINQMQEKVANGEVDPEILMMDLNDSAIVNLRLPKFHLEYQAGLKEPLKNLGMKLMFDGADFSGMTAEEHISVSDVIHKAIIEVEEEGTEDATATDSSGEETSVSADRPFVLFLADRETGLVLFTGVVMEPVGTDLEDN